VVRNLASCSVRLGYQFSTRRPALLTEGFRDFLELLRADAQKISQIIPRSHFSTFSPIHYSRVDLSFDAIQVDE
jgi:hypothetical protein